MPKRLISIFSDEIYSLILPIKFVREPLFVSESLGQRKLLMLNRGYCDFLLIFLASQYRNISWVTPSNLRKNSGIETFYA